MCMDIYYLYSLPRHTIKVNNGYTSYFKGTIKKTYTII